MQRRPVLRFALLLAALAFLLPLAAAEGSCADCLCGDSADCCPPSCCPCCVHMASDLTAPVRVDLQAATVDAAPSAQEPHPSCDPRDIFHVPRASLV